MQYDKPLQQIKDPSSSDSTKYYANADLMKAAITDYYDYLTSLSRTTLKHGPAAAQIAFLTNDLAYHTGRIVVSWREANIINDNLGRPNGKLNAQNTMKQVLEDLVTEQNRRNMKSRNMAVNLNPEK